MAILSYEAIQNERTEYSNEDPFGGVIEFCLFGNYCDETGRHYPAEFSVNVWNYNNGKASEKIYSNTRNTVALDKNGDYAATPVCLALPDSPDEDEYYFEITLLNSDAYAEVEEKVIRSGVINEEDVRSLFDGAKKLDYFHFRQGCENDDTPQLFSSL